MEQQSSNKTKWILLIGSALLVVLLAVGGLLYYVNNFKRIGVVSLDVNPVIELEYNKRQIVLSCTPVNEEGERVLDDLNGGKTLEDMTLQVAVNSLIGSLERHGFLAEANPSILVTVCQDNQNSADILAQELKSSISILLNERAPSASVLTQVIRFDEWRDQKSQTHHLTIGKGALVSRIREKNADLDYDKLGELSVEELDAMLSAGAPSMLVGRDAAYHAAMEYAGVTSDEATLSRIDIHLEQEPAVYETVLLVNGAEESYRVSAYSGQVLEGSANLSTDEEDAAALHTDYKDIGAEAAKTLALRRAGAEAGDAADISVMRKLYDGMPAYEVSFVYNGETHTYTIDGTDGSQLKYQTSDAKGNIISSGGYEKNTDTSVTGGSTGGSSSSSTGGKTGGSTGGGSGSSSGGTTGGSSGGSSSSSSSSGSTTENVLDVGKTKAYAAAVRAYIGTTGSKDMENTSSKTTTYNGKKVYEIGFLKNGTWYYYYVDAESGDVVKEWTQKSQTDGESDTSTIAKKLLGSLGFDPADVSNLKVDNNGTGYLVTFDYQGEHKSYEVAAGGNSYVDLAKKVIEGSGVDLPDVDTGSTESEKISMEEAEEIAANHVIKGKPYTREDVYITKSDDQPLFKYYSIQLTLGGVNYEYQVNYQGEIRKSELKK